MKVTDEKIRIYCKEMDYVLLRIGKIAFEYLKSDGSKCALLKSAAHSLDHKKADNQSLHSDGHGRAV